MQKAYLADLAYPPPPLSGQNPLVATNSVLARSLSSILCEIVSIKNKHNGTRSFLLTFVYYSIIRHDAVELVIKFRCLLVKMTCILASTDTDKQVMINQQRHWAILEIF